MGKVDKILQSMTENPQSVSFNDLFLVCEYFFGQPRQKGTSHCIFRTPWVGNPRINIQNNRGQAKAYQVRQVILAIRRLEGDI